MTIRVLLSIVLLLVSTLQYVSYQYSVSYEVNDTMYPNECTKGLGP